MRLRQIAFLMVVSFCLASVYASAMPLDKYLKLRNELKATNYSVSTVSGSPADYRGKVIELRGTVTGVFTTGDESRIILDCKADDHQIVTCEKKDAPSSGAIVALLTVIGEDSEYSLSDLKLVGWCVNAELKEWETEQAEHAKLEAQRKAEAQARQQEIAQKKQASRTKRGERPTSRGYDYDYIVSAYAKAIHNFNPKLSQSEVDRITNAILSFSSQYEVDPRLVVALVLAESHFRPEATSRAGAMGLGQLMPGTARGLGVRNAYNPEDNLAGAIKLIKGHLDKQSGNASYGELTWSDLELALASYNAGPGAVKKYGGIPPYRETQAYVQRVVKYYKKLCGIK